MEKMSMAKQAETRAMLYEKALGSLAVAGFKTETIKGGALIDLGNGYFRSGNRHHQKMLDRPPFLFANNRSSGKHERQQGEIADNLYHAHLPDG